MYLIRPTVGAGGVSDNRISCINQNKIVGARANAGKRLQHLLEHVYHLCNDAEASVVVIPCKAQ